MNFNQLWQSKKVKLVIVAVGGMAAIILAFGTGEFVGYKKANFSYRWAENYHRNFGGPRSGFLGDFHGPMGNTFGNFPGLGGEPGGDYVKGHGIFGSIMKIDGNIITVKTQDNTEEAVLVSDRTTVRANENTIKPADLKADDRITVIGSPNDQGQIEAKFIRVFR